MEIIDFPNYLIYHDGLIFNQKENIFMKDSNKNGYRQIRLSNNEKRPTFLIHRLIAIHYIPNPENKSQVDHIDGNKSNNHVSNLRWNTRLENMNNFRPMLSNNTSGFKNISYCETNKNYSFKKTINKEKYKKSFKSKTDALCYKFIFILKKKAGLN